MISFNTCPTTFNKLVKELRNQGTRPISRLVRSPYSDCLTKISTNTIEKISDKALEVAEEFKTIPLDFESFKSTLKNVRETESLDEFSKFVQDNLIAISQNKIGKFSIHIDCNDKKSIKQYKKLCFEIKNTEPNYFGEGKPAYYMENNIGELINEFANPEIKTKNDLKNYLENMKEKGEDYNKFSSSFIDKVVEGTKTPEQRTLIAKWAPLDIFNNRDYYNINEVINVAKTPEKAVLAYLLSVGKKSFDYSYIKYIIKSLETPVQNLEAYFLAFFDNDSDDISRVINNDITPAKLLLTYILGIRKLATKDFRYTLNSAYNPEQANLAFKVALCEGEFERPWEEFKELIYSTDGEEQAKFRGDLVEELLKDGKVDGSQLCRIITETKTKQEADLKQEFLIKYGKMEKIDDDNLTRILSHLKCPEQITLFDHLLKFQNLSMNNVSLITLCADTPAKTKWDEEIINKYINNKKLSGDNLASLICGLERPEQIMTLDNLLLKNIDARHMIQIADDVRIPEQVDLVNALFDAKKVNSDNVNLTDSIRLINYYAYTPERVKFAKQVITEKNFLANLTGLNNDIKRILIENLFEEPKNREIIVQNLDKINTIYIVMKKNESSIKQWYNKVSSNILFPAESHPEVALDCILSILNANQTRSYISFHEGFSLQQVLDTIKRGSPIEDVKKLKEIEIDVDKILSGINKRIKQSITTIDVSSDAKLNFFKSFLANNSQIENVIKNVDFNSFGKNGLTLKYPRNKFLEDFNYIIKNLEAPQKNELLRKLELIASFDNNGNLISYEGIPNFKNLDKMNPVENNVFEIITKFMLENEVETNDESFNRIINSMLKAFPEYTNIIGKKQYKTHAYSVDIHTLKVLQESVKNPLYDKLSDGDKVILKMAALFHDIAKQEGVVDKIHPNISALYTKDLLKKVNMPKEMKDRIFELVLNHHWLENCSTNRVSPEKLAVTFSNPQDYLLAKIITDSDLRSVNEEFYQKYEGSLSPESLLPIEKAMEKMYSTGNIIMTSRIVNSSRIPEVNFKDKNYKVIDLNKIDDNQDLDAFGFIPGTKKEDLRFLAHFVRDFKNSGNIVDLLSDASNEGVFSTSLLSPKNKSTYYDNRYGFVFNVQNNNIGNAFYKNQSSGGKRNFDDFCYIVNGNSEYRSFLKGKMIEDLKIKYGQLSDKEYAELYKQIINKKHLTQIHDVKINNKIILEKDLKHAIINAQDSLFNGDKEIHNEVVVYNPEIESLICKEDSLEKVSQEFLDFAYNKNLPVVLLGS